MTAALHSGLRLAPVGVDVEHRPDGSRVLRSPCRLEPHARTVGEWLLRWATDAPDRTFLAERDGADWRRLRYRDTLDTVRRAGQGLLDRGLPCDPT